MMEKSPFFRPSSNHRVVIVQQRTPGGSRRTIQKQETISENKSTLAGAASNLINAIVGAGIVGIPFALRQAGFVSGIVLIILCAFVTEKSLRLLVFTAKHVHVPTYETLAEACFGVIGFRFVAINMFFTAYGAMVSYLMIVKQTLGTLLLGDAEDVEAGRAIALDSVYMRRTILLLVSLAIMLPIASKRDMADLAQTSRFNVLIDSLLVGLVAFNAPIREAAEKAAEQDVPSNMWFRGDTIFVGLGVLSFAYVCQHSAFIIAGSLEKPTTRRWSTVTTAALILCCILNMVCGVMGYLGYREETQGNILENLGRDSLFANIARGLLGTTMLFVYPVESFVARHVCVVLLFSGRMAHEGDDAHILARRDRRFGLTAALYVIAVIPAALTNDLGPILALTGIVGGSCLSYLGPGLIYFGVHGERFLTLARQSFGRGGECIDVGGQTVEEGVIPASGNLERLRAIETTPLVPGSKLRQNRDLAVNSSVTIDTETDDIIVVGLWNHVVWYVTGMPIWCTIARIGKIRLKDHITEIAMKSPHPIRIGDVEYKRALVQMDEDEGGAELKKLVRDNSMPHLPNLVTGNSSVGMNINQQIGQGLLEQQKKQKFTTETVLEADPQEEPPSWLDFYVAIFFILLGLVALFAGIYSLFM
jgi:solute carrier family 38 (sodium-coupled neutral amino acid transporter), member 11